MKYYYVGLFHTFQGPGYTFKPHFINFYKQSERERDKMFYINFIDLGKYLEEYIEIVHFPHSLFLFIL